MLVAVEMDIKRSPLPSRFNQEHYLHSSASKIHWKVWKGDVIVSGRKAHIANKTYPPG